MSASIQAQLEQADTRRNKLMAESQEILDRAGESGSLSETDQSRVDELHESIQDIDRFFKLHQGPSAVGIHVGDMPDDGSFSASR